MASLFERDLNELSQGFRTVFWNLGLKGDWWKGPEVWCRHDVHIPRKRSYFKICLKISMCSSAFHSRSTFPLPHKFSHPHGNFPSTRSFYYFFSLYFLWWLMATGFGLIAEYNKLSENKGPELWRLKAIPVCILMRTLPRFPPVSPLWLPAEAWEYLGTWEGTPRIHFLRSAWAGKASSAASPYIFQVLTYVHTFTSMPQLECVSLYPFPQSSLQTPSVP